MKRLVAALVVMVAMAGFGTANAQQMVGIAYEMSVGTGNTSDFISDYSWRGMSFDYRRFIDRQLALGFHVGWNVLNTKTNETAVLLDGNAALSGTQFRYQNSFPFLFTAQYHFGKHGETRPYVGIGTGPYRIENRVEVGLFAFEDTNWHYGIAPEVGFLMPISYDAHWFMSARWHQAFSSGTVDSQSFFTFQIGITSDTDVF